MAKLLVTVEDEPDPDAAFWPISPPTLDPDVPVTLAFEKLFKMLLGLLLLDVPLLPISPPTMLVPETAPVAKLLVIKPELLPTSPPNVLLVAE